MATIFDILSTINNHSDFYSCKRQKSNSNNINIRDIKRIDVIPSMDVSMTDDNIIIETELAGISKDNIEIDIKDSILTIQGEKKIKNNYKKQQQQQQQHQQQHQQIPDKAKTNINLDEPSIEEYEENEDDNKSNKSTKTTTSTLDNNTINKEENNKKEYKKYLTERSFGHFKRCLDLKSILYQLDLSTIKTNFENGLLTITINKKLNLSKPFKININ
ncbi:hypothetical protein ACTFIV_002701 [Dictyostelium citrinum]